MVNSYVHLVSNKIITVGREATQSALHVTIFTSYLLKDCLRVGAKHGCSDSSRIKSAVRELARFILYQMKALSPDFTGKSKQSSLLT